MKRFNKKHPDFILLKNGYLVDGTGRKGFLGDLLVREKTIVSLSRPGDLVIPGAMVVDLKKKHVVSPGFIDMHGHSEMVPFEIPSMDSKLSQGITTEVVGNCGLSPAPSGRKNARHLKDVYHFEGLKNWKTFSAFIDHLKKIRFHLNIIPLAGHGTLRSFVLGYKKEKLEKGIMTQMREKLCESFRGGAFGLSMGLIYPPGCFAGAKELRMFFKETAKQGRLVTVHMRDEGNNVLKSVEEMTELARKTCAHVHIAHLKVNGRDNWSKCREVCAMIRSARKEGLNITADRYPYTASWTDLDTVLPDSIYAGGHNSEIRLLQNTDSRARIREVFFQKPACKEKDYFQSILIAQVRSLKNKGFEGKTISEIAGIRKSDPFDAICDLLVEEKLMVTAVFFGMKEKNMEKILCEPYTVVGTDSSAKAFDKRSGKPHPRAYGTFPRFFEHFVKGGKMSLEKGVRKCTGLTADILGLENRGFLKKGCEADITVFDLDAIKDRSTYADPVARPEGIEYVMINGRFACFRGEVTGERNGDVLFKN